MPDTTPCRICGGSAYRSLTGYVVHVHGVTDHTADISQNDPTVRPFPINTVKCMAVVDGSVCYGTLQTVATVIETRFLARGADAGVNARVVAYDTRVHDESSDDERVECRSCGAAYEMPPDGTLDYA